MAAARSLTWIDHSQGVDQLIESVDKLAPWIFVVAGGRLPDAHRFELWEFGREELQDRTVLKEEIGLLYGCTLHPEDAKQILDLRAALEWKSPC